MVDTGPLAPRDLLLAQLALDELGAAEASQESCQHDPEPHHGRDDDDPDGRRQLHILAPEVLFFFFFWKYNMMLTKLALLLQPL